ncbi:hypothetical protein [Oryza sativa Japonica Group]|uniref:Uncharacterized protein n=1 Tax=Oryza sativa subsp. japonica TaxID=39947 RepID=Q5JMF8_ORYSJ|nr:hypothetical protein [Oryza sativa Japonica Group]
MTPFNCPAAHASSSPYHLLLLPCSSYSLLSRLRRHFASSSSSSSSRSSSPGGTLFLLRALGSRSGGVRCFASVAGCLA